MNARILVGDVRERLAEIPDKSVRCVVTSPPYFGLRDYNHDGQLGLEATPAEYVKNMVAVFDDVWRVLADDGTLWLNLGDSYGGSGRGPAGDGSKQATNVGADDVGSHHDAEQTQAKGLVGVPWRVAFALQDAGWILRQDIIWAKPNPMPESVKDRCTKSHEYLFLLSKQGRYYFDASAIAEPSVATNDHDATGPGYAAPGQTPQTGNRQPRFGGAKYGDSDDPMHATKSGNEYEPTGTRNKRDVWTIPTQPFKGAHFAVMPEALVTPCVLAGSAEGDTVLDPFSGSGTVGVVALHHQRNYIGVELNPEYAQISRNRIRDDAPMLNEVE